MFKKLKQLFSKDQSLVMKEKKKRNILQSYLRFDVLNKYN
jgi:hypothetical protein